MASETLELASEVGSQGVLGAMRPDGWQNAPSGDKNLRDQSKWRDQSGKRSCYPKYYTASESGSQLNLLEDYLGEQQQQQQWLRWVVFDWLPEAYEQNPRCLFELAPEGASILRHFRRNSRHFRLHSVSFACVRLRLLVSVLAGGIAHLAKVGSYSRRWQGLALRSG